ncbi:MAG TPA: hypothetical protein VKY92_09070 [Verrucomicrobiae bacterium]|nr:hypothetical protein [Verrucomicrobiae bacterium]
MTKKSWTWLGLAVLLGGFSLYLNKDWFAADNIQLMHRSRPARGAFRKARGDNPLIDPISFWFDRKVRLTSLKVVPVFDLETNKFPQPVWALVSESNSVPIKEFTYGMPIRGMHPAEKGSAPDPLLPGIKYRLFADTGKQKVQHDFVPEQRTE